MRVSRHRSDGSRAQLGPVPPPWWLTPEAVSSNALDCRICSQDGAVAHQISWLFTNPFASFTTPAHAERSLSKAQLDVKRPLIASNVVASSGQFVRHRLGRDHRIRLGRFALVIAFDLRMVAHGKVRGLHKCPGQILVTVFRVASPLTFAVTESLAPDTATG